MFSHPVASWMCCLLLISTALFAAVRSMNKRKGAVNNFLFMAVS